MLILYKDFNWDYQLDSTWNLATKDSWALLYMFLINTAAKNTSPTALTTHCILIFPHLQSSSQYSHQQGQCCVPPHVTWYLSTPSPHTKNQPTNVQLLLHTGKHAYGSHLHMAVFHSHLVNISACCCFCVYVLCIQLPWEQKSPQNKVVYTSDSFYKCIIIDDVMISTWYCESIVLEWNYSIQE